MSSEDPTGDHGPGCPGCQILGLMVENARLRKELGREVPAPSGRIPVRVSPTTGRYITAAN